MNTKLLQTSCYNMIVLCFQTIIFLLMSLRNLFLYGIRLTQVSLIVVMGYFEIILWAYMVLEQQIVWIFQELNNDYLWQAIFEKVQNDSLNSLFYDDYNNNVKAATAHNCLLQSKENFEVYMCKKCRNLNQLPTTNEYFMLKTPENKGSNELMDENLELNIHHKLKTQKVNLESLNCSNTSVENKPCLISKKNQESPINSSPDASEQNSVMSHLRSNSFFRVHSKIGETILDSCRFHSMRQQKIRDEHLTFPKNLNKSKSETSIDPLLETPICKFDISRNNCRLEMMNSEKTVPELVIYDDDPVFKRGWKKLKHWVKANDSFKVRKDLKLSLISAISGQDSDTMNSENRDIIEIKHNRNRLWEEQTPKLACCSKILAKLGLKFGQNHYVDSVRYKRF